MILRVKDVLKVYSLSYLLIGINIFISAYFTVLKRVTYSALITFQEEYYSIVFYFWFYQLSLEIDLYGL